MVKYFSVMKFFKENVRWRFGNGSSINILEVVWVDNGDRIMLIGRDGMDLNTKNVAWLIRDGNWDNDLIQEWFEAHEGQLFLRTPLPRTPREDVSFWPHDAKGIYTIKSAYHQLSYSRTFEFPSFQFR